MSKKQIEYIRNFIAIFVIISGVMGTYLYKDFSKEFVTKEAYDKECNRIVKDIDYMQNTQKEFLKSQTKINEKVSILSDHVERGNELTIELIKVLKERD